MIPPRLTVLTLITDDVPGQRAFYEGLGWRAQGPPADDHAIFVLGGATLFLWTAREAEGEVGAPMRAAGHPAPRSSIGINVETREEVDAAIETARRAGATIVNEPADRDWGGRSGHYCSPDGVVWEVAWVPGSAVSDTPAMDWGPPPEG